MICWRCVVAGMLAVGCQASVMRADEPPPGTIPLSIDSFASLKKEFIEASKRAVGARRAAIAMAQQEMQAATTDSERQAVEKKLRSQLAELSLPKFAARFLKFAESHPKDPSAFDALMAAINNCGGPHGEKDVWKRAVELLQTSYADHAGIKKLFPALINSGDAAAERFVRDVMAKHPDRKVQAAACKTLIAGLESSVGMAEMFRDRPGQRLAVERHLGADAVNDLLARAATAPPDIEELKKVLAGKFADIYPDLSVGKTVPEVVSQDLDGEETRLSDLRGKVVVLDIWATWSGTARKMIPHEREMVERLKDQPFALVSISIDAEKQMLIDFLAKEPMPWIHWWNGAKEGVVEAWDVRNIPVIYVLDAKGVIRHGGLSGEDLEKAVNGLLDELSGKKADEPAQDKPSDKAEVDEPDNR